MINFGKLDSTSDDPAREKASGLNILIVEDDIDYAESTAVLLNMAGHKVEITSTALGAVSAVVANQFDVVLLDLGLPGLSGLDIAKWVQGKESVSPPCLIALTGHSKVDFQLQADQSGITHFLTKPVDPSSLLDLLSKIQEEKPNGPDLLVHQYSVRPF